MNKILSVKLFFCFLIFVLSACQTKERKSVKPAFYHWQSDLSLEIEEVNYLQSLNVDKLYIRYFDVDWDAHLKDAVALAPVTFSSPVSHWQIVPVVFITNRTLLKLPDHKLDQLANRIFQKIKSTTSNQSGLTFEEVQIDCDWSGQTRAKYFQLLKMLKQQYQTQNISLSATIRLHQVKYFSKTGVPPVDKGMLMFYNIGDLENPETQNSILDLETAKGYLFNFDTYPLTLDVALPVFYWGVLFRDGKMIKLINNLNAEMLVNDNRFLKKTENQFELLKSTYLKGYYLYKGDILRTEFVSNDLLTQTIDLLSDKIKNENLTVTFYHLDTATIKHYPYERLQKIYQGFW